MLICFSYTVANAQKIKVTDGDPSVLKGQVSVKVEYTYHDMAVGKYKKEQEYIDRKVKDYNDDEPGRGDEWAKAWVNDRNARFEPKFEELINDHLDKTGIIVSENTEESSYTMIVHTVFTEPGYNVVVSRKPAMINLVVSIVETSNPENVLAVIEIEKAPGNSVGGTDYDTGQRISEAYAKAAKELAQFLEKKYLK